MNENELEILSKLMDSKTAKKVLKLTKDYDNYILKFKDKINPLLKPYNIETKVGIAFIHKNKQE